MAAKEIEIGAYTLTEVIGRGEFHEVRLAKKGLSKYAVKRLRYKVDQNDAKSVFDKASNLEACKYVVALEEFLFLQGKPVMYLVMEYCNNKNLNDHIIQDDVKSSHKLGYMVDLAAGLNHLHTMKVIHGDVRPMKVIMAPGEARKICKLTDYGVNLVMEVKVEKPDTREIAEFFRAPEVEKSNQFSTAGDIYSLAQTYFVISSEMQTMRDDKKLLVPAVKVSDGTAHTLNVVVHSGQIEGCLDSRFTLKGLVKLMVQMLNLKPNGRPKADRVMCKVAESQGEFNAKSANTGSFMEGNGNNPLEQFMRLLDILK